MPSIQPALRSLTNQQLAEQIRQLATEERRLTTEIIAHLEEIDRRHLHLELGYASLFEYCISELKYSAAAAQRRIDAMRLTREVPQVREAVEDGRLNLSSVSQAQKFFRHEKKTQNKTYTSEEKLTLLTQLEGTSSRECERKLASISPTFVQQERVRAVSETQTQVTFVATQKLMEDLERIKHLWAHQNPAFTYNELFEKMAHQVLAKIDPMTKSASTNKNGPLEKSSKSGTCASNPGTSASEVISAATPASEIKAGKISAESRHIPAAIRRQVWHRDEGRCAHLNPQTGKQCNSTFMLEIDHIKPYGLGGANDATNLRLLCRLHNQLHSKQVYGTRADLWRAEAQ